MQKPDDIPEDVWEAAGGLDYDFDDFAALRASVARAILAERERCHREFRQQAMAGLIHSPRAFAFRSEAGQRCDANLTSEQDPQNPNRRVLFAVKSPGDEDDEPA